MLEGGCLRRLATGILEALRRLMVKPSAESDRPTSRAKTRAKGLLTRAELAKILNCHPMTIVKWGEDGMPIAERGSRGRPSYYREPEVRAWLQARDAAARHPAALSLAAERAQKERFQAALAEQTLRIRARELLPREEVERAWSARIAATRTKLLAWSITVADKAHRAAALEGLPGVERVLEEEVHQILRELAEPGFGRPPAHVA